MFVYICMFMYTTAWILLCLLFPFFLFRPVRLLCCCRLSTVIQHVLILLKYFRIFVYFYLLFFSLPFPTHTHTHTEADKQRTRRRLLLRSCVFCLVSFHFSAWSFVVFMLRVVSVGERERERKYVCPCLCVCVLVCARVLRLCRCKCEWTRSMSALRRSSLRSMGRNKQLRQQQQQQQHCRA